MSRIAIHIDSAAQDRRSAIDDRHAAFSYKAGPTRDSIRSRLYSLEVQAGWFGARTGRVLNT